MTYITHYNLGAIVWEYYYKNYGGIYTINKLQWKNLFSLHIYLHISAYIKTWKLFCPYYKSTKYCKRLFECIQVYHYFCAIT